VAPDGVTSVTIQGPSSVPFLGSVNLTAVVQGTGSYLPLVTWVLNQGPGAISATTGANITYTAPLVSTPTQVVIYAISQTDSTKHGEIDITITPPPDPGTFWGGATIAGSETHTPSQYPGHGTVTTYATQYTLTKVDANHVAISTLPYWGTPGENAVIITLSADGTLAFPSNFGGVIQYASYPAGAQYQAWLGGGSGQWDFHGNISFTFYAGQDGYFGSFADTYVFSGTKQ